MNKIKIIPAISTSIILAVSFQASAKNNPENQHYMMLSGDGPQGYYMAGSTHKDSLSTPSEQTASHNTASTAKNKHYMMHAGDGPQGHAMEGKKHTTNISPTHTPQYGNTETKNGLHYMMMSGDGLQGFWMKGDVHPESS